MIFRTGNSHEIECKFAQQVDNSQLLKARVRLHDGDFNRRIFSLI